MCIFLYNSQKTKTNNSFQTFGQQYVCMCVIKQIYIIHFERSLENMDYIDQHTKQLNTNCSDNLTEANQG